MNDQETSAPSNIRAEQALLGILLYDNAAFERIPGALQAEHFYDGLHRELYTVMIESISTGKPVEPLMLMERFKHDEALNSHGGLGYLADLVDRAPSSENTVGFAMLIHDLALRRGMMEISRDLYQAADKDRETPAAQLVEGLERKLYTLTAERGESALNDLGGVLGGALEMAAAAYMRDGEMVGLSTGLIDLDARLGGLHPGNLIILAARPSMGKSAMAMGIALHNAISYAPSPTGERQAGGMAAFFSLEMSSDELGMRILSDRAGVSSSRIRRGDIDVHEFSKLRDCAEEIQAAPLYIDDTGALSLSALATRARRLKRTVGLHLIVVDYLQIMTTGKAQPPAERVAEIAGGLKALAKELHIPIVALAQLSRSVDGRSDQRPTLTDLKDSGQIEQDADVVLFLYREAYYLEKAKPKEGSTEFLEWEDKMDKCRNVADIIIGKQRHGPIGSVKVTFNGDLTRFGNQAKEGRFTPS